MVLQGVWDIQECLPHWSLNSTYDPPSLILAFVGLGLSYFEDGEQLISLGIRYIPFVKVDEDLEISFNVSTL